MKKHNNLSIFIPHIGCPCQCSFCNQKQISGTQSQPTIEQVDNLCNEFLPTQKEKAEKTEIAFFGGSFTKINHDYMVQLLEIAYSYIKKNRAMGIRISTRPDGISNEILQLLKQYGVTSIELGAQSMCDQVLLANNRGHNAKQVEQASKMIKEFGFSLGLQMMTGLYLGDEYTKNYLKQNNCVLPEENTQLTSFYDKLYCIDALDTMQKFISLKPDTVRIYPTVVIKGTQLEQEYNQNKYITQSFDSSVALSAQLVQGFEQNNINVIRVGLHADETMQDGIVAGCYHPAFKQLCVAQIYKTKLLDLLLKKEKGEYTILIEKGERSTVAGQKNSNLLYFKNLGYILNLQENLTTSERQLVIL